MTRAALVAAVATLLLAVPRGPAWALGPAAPFLPPRTAAAAALDSATPAAAPVGATAAGLVGIRLGTTTMALIDGQWWLLGSRPRGALLTAVTSRGAWLRHADGRIEHLALHAPFDGAVMRSADRLPSLPSKHPSRPHSTTP